MTRRVDACREELRGGESRCNGGGYDGCACGPYSVADLRENERRSWTRRVGETLYRPSTPADIIGAKVTTADATALYLEKRLSAITTRTFVIDLSNGHIIEYKQAEAMDYDEARADAGLIQ